MGFCFTKKLYCSFPNLIVIVLAWHFTNREKKCNKNAPLFLCKILKNGETFSEKIGKMPQNL